MTAAVEEDVPLGLRARVVRVDAGRIMRWTGDGCRSLSPPTPPSPFRRRSPHICGCADWKPSARTYRKRRRRGPG